MGTRLESAIERLNIARQYTNQFITGLSDDDWFWTPREFTTHIAWQVGHLAVAQYKLCLRCTRGRTPADESLISDHLIESFQLGSQAVAGRTANPPLEEIRRVFGAVFETALEELTGRSDEEFDVPLEQPHPTFKTKLAAVEYCPPHEFVHAGQIALLRRLMGKPPVR